MTWLQLLLSKARREELARILQGLGARLKKVMIYQYSWTPESFLQAYNTSNGNLLWTSSTPVAGLCGDRLRLFDSSNQMKVPATIPKGLSQLAYCQNKTFLNVFSFARNGSLVMTLQLATTGIVTFEFYKRDVVSVDANSVLRMNPATGVVVWQTLYSSLNPMAIPIVLVSNFFQGTVIIGPEGACPTVESRRSPSEGTGRRSTGLLTRFGGGLPNPSS